MVISRSDTAVKEKERLVKEILSWNRSDEKVLNIVTVPFSKCDVFEEIIFKYIREGKSVLYITNDDIGIKALVEMLKRRDFNGYSCNLEGITKVKEDNSLVIIAAEGAISIRKSYDLVIYDDIVSFSKYNKFEMLDLLAFFYKTSKIICRSMECVFQNAPCIEVPLREKGVPIIEPRIITTRLDLSRELPAVIYDYLVWSISCDKNVIILTPGEEMSVRVHEYLLNIKENLFTNVFLFKDIRNRELQYFLDKRKGIVVTHNIDIIKMKLSNTDFIVYYAEDRNFEYKKLVYLCSKASDGVINNLGEVILLSNDISRDMENCRDIIRRFNKQIWDMGLVRV